MSRATRTRAILRALECILFWKPDPNDRHATSDTGRLYQLHVIKGQLRELDRELADACLSVHALSGHTRMMMLIDARWATLSHEARMAHGTRELRRLLRTPTKTSARSCTPRPPSSALPPPCAAHVGSGDAPSTVASVDVSATQGRPRRATQARAR